MIAHTQEQADPRRVRSPPDGEAVVAGRRATSGWSAELEFLFLILLPGSAGCPALVPHADALSRSQSLPSPRISPAHLSLQSNNKASRPQLLQCMDSSVCIHLQ